jgi:hypothetical protein
MPTELSSKPEEKTSLGKFMHTWDSNVKAGLRMVLKM